ncbi:MAG TPA: alpha-amylase family glycosyl hydrolase [Opitutus sp.]|nr:alpha-amylase family glycosyl hydrolase [Opitutus sp.]
MATNVAVAGQFAATPPAGWWRDAVFYEIFVRSFADASSGPLAGDGIGDFQGLIDHLDYLNDGRGAAGNSLGVNAVWLMPIQPSPSYHGYDVTDYFATNPQYGDLALFKRFVAEAHKRGIRVIIDLVLNHCSSRHPLFLKALTENAGGEERRMFRFAPLPENIVGPWDQRAWHPSPAADGTFYYGVFSDEMPDWNLRDAAVTEHHRRTAEFWLREVGVDGFRLDAVRYLIETGDELQDTAETRAWLKEFTDYCHTVKPGSFVVGEDTARMPEVARCIRGGSLDSAFEFDLARATIEALRLQTGGILTQALAKLDGLYDGDARWSAFLSNHDQDRVRSQLGDSDAKVRLAAKLLFTLPGTTFVYYGEELGMAGRKPDPDLRTPMPWNGRAPNADFTESQARPWHALNPDFGSVNVATESADPASLLALYRRLIRLHASSPALRHGQPIEIAVNDRGIYAAMRATDDEAILVIANPTEAAREGVSVSARDTPIRGSWTVREEIDGAAITAPPLSAAGGFTNWTPLGSLPANAAYLVRWTRR